MSDEVVNRAGRSLPGSVDAVLQWAWSADDFTSSDVMPAVGLTRSTTIEAIDQLIAVGLVDELANARSDAEYRKGRPARRFRFRRDAAAVVGVDAGRGHIIAAVADLGGRVLARAEVAMADGHDGADERRRAVDGAVATAVESSGVDRRSIVALCAGVPAPVDRDGCSPAHDFWSRMNPGLRGALSHWAPAVRVENDASLAAVAEGAAGAAIGCDNYIALLAGDRLGSGVVLDGRLLRGAHGGVGELIPFDHVEGVGSVDGVGMRITQWAREDVAAGRIAAGRPLARIPTDELTAAAVFASASEGDADAAAIIARSARVIARTAAVFGGFFDPEMIVFCGAVSSSVEIALAPARALLQDEMHLPAPQLVASFLGADVVASGAVAAAIEEARTSLLAFAADAAQRVEA